MSDWQSIKYRLIGATVIVASFAFAWWLMLDHEVHRLQGMQADIPEPMTIERFDIDEPQLPVEPAASEQQVQEEVVPEGVAQETGLENAAVPETESRSQPVAEKPVAMPTAKPVATPTAKPVATPTAKPVATPAAKPSPGLSTLDQKGLPEAWVLQVASFHEKANAQQLQQKLVGKNFPAYVKAFNMPDGKNFRVLVGPKLSKEKAALMAKKIEKEFGLKTMIVTYKLGFEE